MQQNFFTSLMTDAALRNRFKAEPNKVLAEFSIPGFEGRNVIVHENNATTMNFTLLPRDSKIDESKIDPRFMKIQKMAWENAEFVEKLMSDTRNTLMEFFGSIPENMTVNIFRNTGDTQHVIIPAAPNASEELSDDDLEMVAGGKGSAADALSDVGRVVGTAVDHLAQGAQDIVKKESWVGKGSMTDPNFWVGEGSATDPNAWKDLFSGW
ncbi:MAG: hypothetical protein CVV64_18615 [Candidatus Wallbacteria bacterium HGW-Wallbacteria-1]|jgi:hypothetical protein|uniref:Nitrile hydratase alpha /Thiocyanate hydrolase gamma domain-containing protein n=1 Tax=Candidatus Wallbacteria bacterium HGW-Wallbacteria-1 TaxID=2013854 RepID=A0A2N1PJF0_9BACT|nr:MAG: hypothetical protein CVV64_18615 [Candidatus Wallbacteria bacterium HGW-Wallbacteria-1]